MYSPHSSSKIAFPLTPRDICLKIDQFEFNGIKLLKSLVALSCPKLTFFDVILCKRSGMASFEVFGPVVVCFRVLEIATFFSSCRVKTERWRFERSGGWFFEFDFFSNSSHGFTCRQNFCCLITSVVRYITKGKSNLQHVDFFCGEFPILREYVSKKINPK